MSKNSTNSYRDRQKILNNSYIIQKIEKHLCIYIGNVELQNKCFATKNNLARFFDLDIAEKMQSISQQKNRRITRQELDCIVANSEYDLDCQPFLKEVGNLLPVVDRFYLSSDKEFTAILNKRLEVDRKTITEIGKDEFISVKSESVKEKLTKPEILATFQRL